MNKTGAAIAAIEMVAEKYKISKEQILEHSRKKYVVQARKEVMYLLREKVGLSYSHIGELMRRDHTTVMHSLRGYIASDDLNVVDFAIGEEKIGLGTFDNGFHLVQPRSGKWSRVFQDRGKQCEIIGCGFNDVLEVHHFISKKAGGTDELYNLLVVCPNHHTMIHQDMIRFNPSAYPSLRIPSYLSTK